MKEFLKELENIKEEYIKVLNKLKLVVQNGSIDVADDLSNFSEVEKKIKSSKFELNHHASHLNMKINELEAEYHVLHYDKLQKLRYDKESNIAVRDEDINIALKADQELAIRKQKINFLYNLLTYINDSQKTLENRSFELDRYIKIMQWKNQRY